MIKKGEEPSKKLPATSLRPEPSARAHAEGSRPSDHELQTKLTWLPKKTFELEITIPWSRAEKTYQQALQEEAKKVEIKGFRKGKAPLHLVEEKIDQKTLWEKTAQILILQASQESIQKHQLRPICSPQVTPTKLEKGKDWLLKITACEAPEIKLGEYEKEIRGALGKTKIWTPDKGKPTQQAEAKQKNERINIVLETLSKTCQVELSDMVIEEDTKRRLARLLEQINKLGLSLEEYLAANQKTVEQFRDEQRKLIEKTLKLEFILSKIAQEKGIKAEEKEISDIIAKTADEKVRQNLEKPEQRAFLTLILQKQKTLDFLTNL